MILVPTGLPWDLTRKPRASGDDPDGGGYYLVHEA